MAAVLSRSETVHALRTFGWRVRTTGELTADLRNFQRAYNLSGSLAIDGVNGPKTSAALDNSIQQHKANKPDMSANFSFREFACHCGGAFAKCQRIWIIGDHVDRLEKIRKEFYPHGLTVESGCRCEGWNSHVGGAANSQHKYGGATDIKPVVSHQKMASTHLVAGVGFDESDGKVAHVDSRDISGHNTTGATRTHPTVWIYHR